MENCRRNITSATSDCVSLKNDGNEEKSSWSRSSSFSLSSNDSCNSNSHHSTFPENPHPHMPIKVRSALRKRTRNSSGSSVSSTMSSVSDKDAKKAAVGSPSVSQIPLDESLNREAIASLISPNHNSFELEHKRPLLNERLSYQSSTSTTLPVRRNLRRNIRRKKCSCCTSTSFTTEIVFRKYKEVGKKTVKEETVIASTKVKTYVQNATQEVHQVTYQQQTEKCFSPERLDSNRKRKSELQKLYESLHEMGSQWAKDMSPDNILKPLDIRQAASSSAFGRSPSEKGSPNKKRKRHSTGSSDKSFSNHIQENDLDSSCFENESVVKALQSMPNKTCIEKIVSPKQNAISYLSHESNNSPFEDSACAQIGPKNRSFIPPSKFNFELSPIHVSKSDISEQGKTILTDQSLSSSPQSLSASVIEVSAKSDFSFVELNTPNKCSNITIPTFFNVADEDLTNVDECFQEVAAEVVITTCVEENYELPLLMSMKESHLNISTQSNDDGPPILEPCIEIEVQGCIETTESFSEDILLPECHKAKDSDSNIETKSSNSFQCYTDIVDSRPKCKRKEMMFSTPKKVSLIQPKKSLSLKKRLKYPKEHLYIPSNCIQIDEDSVNEPVGIIKLVKPQVPVLNKVNSNIKRTNFGDYSMLSGALSFQSQDCMKDSSSIKQPFKEFVENLNKFPCDYEKKKQLCQSDINPSFSEITAFDYMDNSNLITNNGFNLQTTMPSSPSTVNVIPSTSTIDAKKDPLQISFSLHYTTLCINRGAGFLQVALKNRFLTLEGLQELKDIFSGSDSNYQVLIISGMQGCFCLGLELDPLLGSNKARASSELAIAVKEMVTNLSRIRKPVVAIVDGAASGLGVTMLNYMDVIIASDRSTFCMPYAQMGFLPEGGASLTLPLAVGSSIAKDLLMRGRTLTAHEALNIGLINEVMSVDGMAHSLLSRLKVLTSTSPLANETTKSMMRMRLLMELPQVLENEVKLLPCMWLSDSCQKSMQEWVQKESSCTSQ